MSKKLNAKTVCEIARSLEGIEEQDHFGSNAFKANKRIFATVWFDKEKVNLRLSPEKQKYFLVKDELAFSEIDSKWGKQGWTTVNLPEVSDKLFKEALQSAYEYSETVVRKPSKKTKK